MKDAYKLLLLLSMLLAFCPLASAQYTGGDFGGFANSRSDDILYDGTAPVVTGSELPDIVHTLTVDNPGGVTLSKSITLNSTLTLLDGHLDLNGNELDLGDRASLIETPGHTIVGAAGEIKVTRSLNNIAGGENVANLGLVLKSQQALGATEIGRGHAPQQVTAGKEGARRFFDITPEVNQGLDVFVEFHYDPTELSGIPEADLALFISHEAKTTGGAAVQAKVAGGAALAAATTSQPQWQFLGGTVNPSQSAVCKGGLGDFSRLTLARGFVFLADENINIEGNEISEGDMHSNKDIHFHSGEPGTHTGNLSAVDDIKISQRNTIAGNAFAGDRLKVSSRANITGTAEETAVTPILMPAPAFSAGGDDITVEKDGTTVLAPGRYGRLEVEKNGTLFLSAGDYFFEKFETERGAVLAIDVAGGPVNVNVVRDLDFGDDTKVEITPLGQKGSNQVAFTLLQKGRVQIGRRALVLGWIVAPQAKVKFERGSRFKGSVVARAIGVEEGVPFLSHASETVLGKTAEPEVQLEKAVELDAEVITKYELLQNYPNPFNGRTIIRFSIPETTSGSLSIYDSNGRLVRTLARGEFQPGRYSFVWDGRNDDGTVVASGHYFSRLRAGTFVAQKKLVFLK